MAKTSKNVYIRCPRCELNYIKKKDQYCDICKREMKLIESDDDIKFGGWIMYKFLKPKYLIYDILNE